jgi:Putative methyltransferase
MALFFNKLSTILNLVLRLLELRSFWKKKKKKMNNNHDHYHNFNQLLSYSLYYYDLARWLFLTLAFTSILSTGWFGIPLAPSYFTGKDIDTFSFIFTISSILGSVWGVMAYREFTRSKGHVISALRLCKKLDPNIGNYVYSSFNPISKTYERGYVPLGPVYFWDPETTVPEWLDKGKYWYILLGLQFNNKDNILLKVVSDDELQLFSQKQNVATTSKKLLVKRKLIKKNYQYVVCIPQWLVMDTDFNRFPSIKYKLNISDSELVNLVNNINNQLIYATKEIIEQERQRIKYPWKIGTFLVYINKSLPIRILYKEILYKFKKYIPGQKKNLIDEVNLKLAYVTNKELINSLLLLVKIKDTPTESLYKISSLLKFLDNAYKMQGLGDGSNRYHNFHHSLEVAYVGLQLLPKKLYDFEFSEKDFELLTVASLLHDYDPAQNYNIKVSIGLGKAEGPKVERTLQELSRNKIHEAYFLLNSSEFKRYFDKYYSYSLPPVEYSTTHPEFIQSMDKNDEKEKPIESIIVEAMILRTDYPFNLKLDSQKEFQEILRDLNLKGINSKKYDVLAQVLWLTDLSVAYMSSDPLNAWNRVINLYSEVYLPKTTIISKTDQFFLQFVGNDLFLNLLNNKSLPYIFKQRWSLVNQFYHEGNPSTIINRTISRAKKSRSYSKFNLEIGVRTGSMLYEIAMSHPDEYFIGIGMNFDVVYHIKNKSSRLEAKNASCFWGNAEKLLPDIRNKTIDNIFYIIHTEDENDSFYKKDLSNIFRYASDILNQNGTIQILIISNTATTNINSAPVPINNSHTTDLKKEIIDIGNLFNFYQGQDNTSYSYFNILDGKEYLTKNESQYNQLIIIIFKQKY